MIKGHFFAGAAAAILSAVIFIQQPAFGAQTPHIIVEESTESGDGGQPDDETNPGITSGTLKIDDANVYDGMGKAYKDGYEPVISGNTANIIIPLKAEAEADFDSVTASLNLGDTTTSPFVYKNYQKTFQKTTEFINGTENTADIFLVRFELELSADRYNGIYPVEVQAFTGSGINAAFQSFTVYVRITDGKETETETEAPMPETEEKPTSQPIMMISKSKVEPKTVMAGEDFEVKAVLKNTSKIKDIQNMALTVTWSSPDITLLEDSNMFYIDYIGAGQTKEMTFKCTAGTKTADGKYEMKLDMSYDTLKAETLTSSGSIQVAVVQPMEVKLEVGDIPTEVNAGDSLSVPLQVLNLGRGKIYNVRCAMDVPGLISDTSVFLGNMEGGSAASGELKVFAGTKKMNSDMTEASPYGPTSGKIELIYEDENGKEYTSQYDVATTINELKIDAASGETEEKEDVKTQWWIAVLAGAVIIIAGGGIPAILYWKKRKTR